MCPPVDELEQHAGETLGLTYAAEVEAEGALDCTYESDDSDLRVMIGCSNYESVEAAVDDMQLRLDYVEGTEPYDGVAGGQAGLGELLDYLMVTIVA